MVSMDNLNRHTAANPGGVLVCVISRARDLPNRRAMIKQDPYVLLRVGNVSKRTAAVVRGGQTPTWDAEVRFDIEPQSSPLLHLSILDDCDGAPVLVSETSIDFGDTFDTFSSDIRAYIHDSWYDLYYNGKLAGEVFLEFTFYPKRPIPKVPTAPVADTPSQMRKVRISMETPLPRPLPAIPGSAQPQFSRSFDDSATITPHTPHTPLPQFSRSLPATEPRSPPHSLRRKPPPSRVTRGTASDVRPLPFAPNAIAAPQIDPTVHSLPMRPADELYSPEHAAPTPSSLLQHDRLRVGLVARGDFEIDPGRAGYRGAGRWLDDPSQLGSAGSVGSVGSAGLLGGADGRPALPPKVPAGMTQAEYYAINHQGYVDSLLGDRE